MEGSLLVVGCGQLRYVAAASSGPQGWEAEVCISEARYEVPKGKEASDASQSILCSLRVLLCAWAWRALGDALWSPPMSVQTQQNKCLWVLILIWRPVCLLF